MTMVISGDGSITGLVAGGLPDATVTAADIVDATVTPAKLSQPLTLGTAVATTSGTSIDFTGIPSWVKRITLEMAGVSTSGTSELQFRIGTGVTPDVTGYLGASSFFALGSMGTANYTTGFGAYNSVTAASTRHGTIVFHLLNAATNTWVCNGGFSESTNTLQVLTFGSKALAGALGVVRLTTVNGTDTFDAGSVNIMYEG